MDTALVLLVVMTLPLEFTKQFFPVTWIELTRVFMGLGILRLAYLTVMGRLRPMPRLVTWAVLAVVVVATASWLLTRWPGGALEAAAIVLYALFACYLVQVLRTDRQLKLVAGALVISAGYVALIAVLQETFDFYLWRGDGLAVLGHRNSTFRDPNITARQLLIGFSAALGLYAATRMSSKMTPALVTVATLALIGIGEALTLSRFGLLVAVVLVLGWSLTLFKQWRLILPLAAFSAGVLAVGIAVPSAQSRVGQIPELVPEETQGTVEPSSSPSQSPTESPSATRNSTFADPVIQRLPLDPARRYLIRAGTAIFQDHPIFGVGLAGAQYEILHAYRHFIPPDRRAAPASLIHTEVVRIAAETGLIGLLALLALVASVVIHLRSAWRQASVPQRWAILGVSSALFVILAASQSEGRFYDEPYLWLLLGLLGTPALWGAQLGSSPIVAPGREP